MNILSIHLARAIWLFPTAYLNPNGSSTIPVVRELISRYSFSTDNPLTEVFVPEQNALELKHGEFVTENDGLIQISLTVYGDGLVADTRSSTQNSDYFLEEVLKLAVDNFGLEPEKKLPINRKYLSEIYFSLNKTPELFSKLTHTLIEKSSNCIDNNKLGNFGFHGIHLKTDPVFSDNSPFIRVERAENTPFIENRFFSSGSIKTDDHIKLLKELETDDCR